MPTENVMTVVLRSPLPVLSNQPAGHSSTVYLQIILEISVFSSNNPNGRLNKIDIIFLKSYYFMLLTTRYVCTIIRFTLTVLYVRDGV